MDKRRRRGGWTREEEENGQENKRRKVDSIKRRGRRGGEGFGTHYFVKAFLTLSLKQKIHCCVIYLTVWRRIPLVQSISIIIRRPHKGSNKRLYGRHQWLFPSPFRSQDKTDTDLRFLAWGHKKKNEAVDSNSGCKWKKQATNALVYESTSYFQWCRYINIISGIFKVRSQHSWAGQ